MHKPEHIKRWWGILDDGLFRFRSARSTPRPGGAWRFVNRTPKGELVEFYGEYREVNPPERVVFTEIFEPYPDSGSVVTAVLHGRARQDASAR